MLSRQGKAKEVHYHQALIIWNVKGTYLRKRRSKLSIVKWQQTHNDQQLNLKKQNKNTLSKHLEQEQNHRYGDMFEWLYTII